MIKIMSILLILLLGSIGLLKAETSQVENTNVNTNEQHQTEHQIEIPKKILYRYLIKRAFEGLGKRNGDDDEYFSNEYNKRAFEGLGRRNDDSNEYFSNEYNKRAFEGLGKRAFEGLGKRSLYYRVIKRQFDGLGK